MNTKQRKKIRELKLTNPKKYIRLKYILYYFPFLKEDNNNERLRHLSGFLL